VALPASDSFTTGSAGTDLTAYSANWTAAWSTSTAQLELDGSGNARVATAGPDSGDFWNADTFAANHYSETIVDCHPSIDTDKVGPSVRHASVGNFYGCQAAYNGVEVFEAVGGTFANIGSNISVSWGTGDHTLKMSASGTDLTISCDGVDTVRTDASHSSGKAGVVGWLFGGTGASVIRSWTADDLPVPPVTFTAIGTKTGTGSTTTVSIAHPAGTAADQVLIAGRVAWETGISFTDESGWTASGELAGGTGTAADAHTTAVRVDRKEISGADAGPTVFDQTGALGATGIMASYTKSPGTATWDFATATGDDATHGANRSVTASSSIALDVNDVVTAWVAVDTDVSLTITSPAITASGITFGTTTQRAPVSAGSTTGDDGNIYMFDATVTAGSGTVAPVLNFTTATSQCGPVAFVRLRAVTATTVVPPPIRRRNLQLTFR
jgi:hypothetical protein